MTAVKKCQKILVNLEIRIPIEPKEYDDQIS